MTTLTRIQHSLLVALATAIVLTFPYYLTAQASADWEAQLPHSGQSIFDQINRQDIVEVTLTANLDSLINVRKTESYSEGKFNYRDSKGVSHAYNVRLKPRGKFRRRVCDMPPLKIKFSKSELEAAGLTTHNDIKLVTHCLNGEPYNEELVLREYLIYKLYNEMTPQSFRVQLLRITYRHIQDNRLESVRYGFLIEDVDELAERIGGKECDDCYALADDLFQPNAERISSLFQFMVGNVDWSMDMNRNVKMIAMKNGTYVPVPYDFDFSVLVSAPYLRPNADVKQTGNMERVFMGNAGSADELYSTLAYFKTKKARLLEIVRGYRWLSTEERYAIEVYLESFFKGLNTKETAQQMIFKDQG